MLSQSLSKSLKAQAWTMLGVGFLFLSACSGSNPVDSSTEKEKPNPLPKVVSVIAAPASLVPGQISTLTVMAKDPLGDDLSYSWSARGGKISGNGKKATFIAGYNPGMAYVNVEIKDDRGGSAGGTATIRIE